MKGFLKIFEPSGDENFERKPLFYCYCLQHRRNLDLYYGYTDDLERRPQEHQRDDQNWELVYYEAYRSEKDARLRERKLKQYGQARTHLKNRIKDSLLGK